MSKSTIGTYKKTVWLSCAKYIKVRDADNDGWCKCCTCDRRMRYDDPICNAGHFVPGHNNTTYFDERIIHAQCADCNCAGSGEQYAYGRFMKEKYGYDDGILDEFRSMRYKTKKVSMEELKGLKKFFDDEYTRIKKEKGL